MPQQPPNVNGIMELTQAGSEAIKTKLKAIQAAFVETDEQSVYDTFYLVSIYNKQNEGKEINGDTAEFIMK